MGEHNCYKKLKIMKNDRIIFFYLKKYKIHFVANKTFFEMKNCFTGFINLYHLRVFLIGYSWLFCMYHFYYFTVSYIKLYKTRPKCQYKIIEFNSTSILNMCYIG